MYEKSSVGSDKILVLRHSIIKPQWKAADSNAPWLHGRDSTFGDRGRSRQWVTRILRIILVKPAASIISRSVIREGQTPAPFVCLRKAIIKSGNLKLINFCSLLNEAISSRDSTGRVRSSKMKCKGLEVIGIGLRKEKSRKSQWRAAKTQSRFRGSRPNLKPRVYRSHMDTSQ